MDFIMSLLNLNSDIGAIDISNCEYFRLVKLQWMKCGNHDIE